MSTVLARLRTDSVSSRGSQDSLSKVRDRQQIAQVLAAVDESRSGSLSHEQLKTGLRMAGISFNTTEFSQLLDRADPDRSGHVRINDFVERIQDGASPARSRTSTPNTSTPVSILRSPSQPSASRERRVIETLRNKVRAKGEIVGKVFRSYDADNDGEINRDEFYSSLKTVGVSLSRSEFDMLMRQVESSGGGVRYEDLTSWLAQREQIADAAIPERNKSSYDIIANREFATNSPSPHLPQAKIIEKIRHAVQTKSKHLRKAFRQLDLNHDGVLSYGELRSALGQMGLDLNEDEFSRVAEHFDQDNSGEIDYDRFADVVLDDKFDHDLLATPSKSTSKTFVSSLGSFNPITNMPSGVAAADAEPNPASERRKSLSFISSVPDYDIIRHVRAENLASPARPMPAVSHKQLRDDRRIVDKIREKVSGKSKRFAKVFRTFDENHDGVVSHEEFRKGLRQLGAPLTDSEFERLITRCDPDDTGEIDYDSFASVILRQDFGDDVVRSARGGRVATADSKRDSQILEMLQDKLAARSHKLAHVFRHFDSDHDGTVSYAELRKGLESLNVNLTDDDFDKLTSRLDVEQKGYVDYNEFARTLKQSDTGGDLDMSDPSLQRYMLSSSATGEYTSLVPSPKVASRPVSSQHDLQLIQRVSSVMARNPEMLMRTFRKMDRDYDGKVAYSELKHALADARVSFTDHEFQRLISIVDRNGDGFIDYSEFADVFMAPDPQKELAEHNAVTPKKMDIQERERLNQQNRILRDIRDKVAGKAARVSKVFREFDENHDGTLSADELRSGLTTLGVQLNDNEFDDLIKLVGDESGAVDYEDFATVFKEPDHVEAIPDTERDRALQAYLQKRRASAVSPSSLSEGGVIETGHASGRRTRKMQQDAIDEAIVKRVVDATMKNPNQIRKAFKRLDRDFDGKISYAEFRRGLCNMKVGLSEAELQRLIVKCDVDRDGFIDFNEFVSVFGGATANAATAVPEQVKVQEVIESDPTLSRIRDKINQKSRHLQKVFRAFDEDHNGTVSVEELRSGLTGLGCNVTEDEFEKILQVVDPQNEQKINYAEFAKVFEPRGVDQYSAVFTEHHDPYLREAAQRQRAQRKPVEEATSLNVSGATTKRSDNPFQALIDDKIVQRVVQGVLKNPRQLRKTFRRLDRDMDGRISYQEFKHGLCDMRIDVTEADMQRLVQQCDRDGEGVIDYNAFCSVFGSETPSVQERPQPSPTKLHATCQFVAEQPIQFEEANATESRMRAAVNGRMHSFKKTLRDLDSSYSGTITHQELKRGLMRFGIELTPREFNDVISKVDPLNVGYVNYERFARHFSEPERPRSASAIPSRNESIRGLVRGTMTPNRILHLRAGPPEARTRQFIQPSTVHTQLGLLDLKRQSEQMARTARRLSE